MKNRKVMAGDDEIYARQRVKYLGNTGSHIKNDEKRNRVVTLRPKNILKCKM